MGTLSTSRQPDVIVCGSVILRNRTGMQGSCWLAGFLLSNSLTSGYDMACTDLLSALA